MSNTRIGPVSSSPTLPDAEARTVRRDRVQAARFSSHEMEEVDAAAKRERKSTSAWLRDVALQAARPAPDTTELVLAEVAATRFMLLNLFHASATATQDGTALTPEAVLKIRETADSRKQQTARKLLQDFVAVEGKTGGRPMRKPLLFVVLILCIAVFNLANLTPLLGPLLYTMTPLQRYYAADYLASSWHRDDPAATTETRPIWKIGKDKTAKGKAEKSKLELATEQDLVALPPRELIGTFSPEPFRLSDEAFAERWTGLRRDNPHQVKSALLADILQQQIFSGYPLWRFFRQPALGLVVLFVLWLVIRAWRKERWKRNMWNTIGKENLSFLAWSTEVSNRVTKRWLPEPKAPKVLSAPVVRQLQLKAPAPVIEGKPASPTRNPVVVQTTIPIAPAAPAKPKPVFVWDESQGID